MIPELDFEMPPEAQRGKLSTVEGVLLRAAEELQALQEERMKVDPETAKTFDRFFIKLKSCAKGNVSFTFILDDLAGNNFIENLFAPSSDPALTVKFYDRTPEQQVSLGFLAESTAGEEESEHGGGGEVRIERTEKTKYIPAETRRESHEQRVVIMQLLKVPVRKLLSPR
ncbi:hypothetical protein AMTR_s00055p00045090 [Amborella trichopoda]|uniref:Zinc finger ZPR1-type domain-containing protein n=2 Tax=Amborella trichopoda TaxID=13333 RepID=U5DCT6_AMBTC|nr:hypothetical protein AMTR_s00055p00045090 [Amborella trichopoda]